MFALITSPARTIVSQRCIRSVSTISRDATASVNPNAAPAATISTTATTAASSVPLNHVLDNGRVTSKNRTYHSTSSWEVRDQPSNAPSVNSTSRTAQEEKRRLARNRNAMEML
ncbi:unnamed protein product [Sympodiomycopsis kandeliae]